MSHHEAPRLSPTMASRKLQLLAFIEIYYGQHGVGPSHSEMAAALSASTSRVKELLAKLEREGRIHRMRGVTRGIRPISAEQEAIRRLAAAGYILPKAGLVALPVLDHHPRRDGEEETEEQPEG